VRDNDSVELALKSLMCQPIFYPAIPSLFHDIFHTNRQLCSAEIEYNLDNYLEHAAFHN
jgi:hypothetical protein